MYRKFKIFIRHLHELVHWKCLLDLLSIETMLWCRSFCCLVNTWYFQVVACSFVLSNIYLLTLICYLVNVKWSTSWTVILGLTQYYKHVAVPVTKYTDNDNRVISFLRFWQFISKKMLQCYDVRNLNCTCILVINSNSEYTTALWRHNIVRLLFTFSF